MKTDKTKLFFTALYVLAVMSLFPGNVFAQNPPEQEAWLQDAGFGMFIHWNVDVQLGTVISHTLVGASEDYVKRYFNELPKTFNPNDFDADRYAVLAKLAGMKYMVFTTKHHSGFCMWDTETTDFNITNTPYKKDIVKEYVDACRRHGLKVGMYFSPEDFLFLHQNGELIRRSNIEKVSDQLRRDYLNYVKQQCTELMTHYGSIDMLFFDGGENFLIDDLKTHCRGINPDVLITRGEINTPEQHLPGTGSEKVWEACMTMGTQWAFKPTNEEYKPGGQIIKILTQTRARGGALLLNVGPDPYGVIPFEQERNLREVAAWYFINHEAVDGVRPWILTNEEDIWFTRKAGTNTVFAIIFHSDTWPRGERREFLLHSIRAGRDTRISILGQNDKIVEYQPDKDPESLYNQRENGLEISVVRAQRVYNNHKWPNPIVVKLENVEAALEPPVVASIDEARVSDRGVGLSLNLIDIGDADKVEVGIEYRLAPGSLNAVGKEESWMQSSYTETNKVGEYSFTLQDIPAGNYQYRAVVRHPLISKSGEIYSFRK